MENKPKLKKLKLSKETIRSLQEAEMNLIVGGSDGGCTCNPVHTQGCWSWQCGTSPVHAPVCNPGPSGCC